MNKKTLLSLMMLLLASIGMARADEPSVHEGIISWTEPITTEHANRNQFFNFEDGQIPAGWTNDNNYPWTVVSNAYSGYNGTYCIKSGNGGISSSTSSISTTVNYSQDGTVSFLGGCWGEGTTNIWDKCQFFIDDVEQFSNGALQTWSNYSFIVPAGTHTFRWSYTKDGSVNPTGDAFFIDDVTFNDSGTICLAPSNLTVTNATATSATLSWTENDDSESWYIYYRHNAPIPTPLPYDTVSASVNPFTLTGLVSNAHYEAFVVPACGVGTQDFYQFASNTVDFTPADSYSITVSANLPNAGTVTGGGEYSFGDTCTLTATPNIGYYLYSWMKDGVMIGEYYQDEYTFTVTESANIVANFQQIEYYPYITSMPEGGGWGEVVGLDYATSGAIHYGDAVTLRAIPNEDFRFYKWTMWVGTDNDYYNIDLSTDSIYTFTFDENFVGFDAGNQGEIEFVANFVESIGDCVRPLDLTATEVGPTSATLSWTELGTSQAWMMYYRPAFTPAYVPYDSLEIYQNPYTLTGLQPNTAYEAYIVPSCGFTDGIANEYLASNTVTFTTLEACPAPFNLQVSNITHNSATVAWTGYNDEYTFCYRVATELIDPVFSEGFEGGVIPQGWSNQGDASWEVGVGDYTPDTISAHSGNYNAKITHNNSQEQTYFVMPSMNLGGQNDLVLSFWYINRSWGGDIDELGVYYRFGTEGAQGAWQPLWSTTEAHETWTNQVVELTGLSDNYQIGFLFTDHYGYGVGLDDIVIAHEQISEWITLSDATNPLELTDLTPGTNYEVRVMGSCDETQTGWSNSAFFTTNDAVYYTITASANPAAGGNVTGGGSYMQGARCTLTATASTGYTFTNWTENGNVVSTSPNYSFTVTGARTLVANFSQNSYAITVTANPTEGGTVTGGGTYNHGQSITLTATPNEGYTFTGWSDGVTTNPRTVTVTGPATYVANFELQSFNITVSADPTEGGTVSGGGTYNYGTSATLTATPAAGYAFINWTKNGTVVSTNATYILNVTEGGTYVAHFSQNSYTLTINYKFANGTTAAPTHTENVSYGASYSVTSPTITGYTPDMPVVSGTMGAEDVTVDVTYNVNSYTLTINYKYANGTTAAPTHTEDFDYGASYSITSPTITGYTPSLPVVSGTMGAEDVTVDVTYSDNSYTLTINYKYANGTTAAPTYTENVSYGASYSVTSPAITGYTPNLPVVSGTMGAEDVTVDVTYSVNSYTLTINYKFANGTTAAPTHTEILDYGASYSVTSPTITGFTPSLPIVSGTMGAEDVTVDVTYSDNSYTLTINYKYANGTTAAPTHTENVSYGASYSVTSPAITGYTPNLPVVSGTMGAEDVTVDVTYSVNSYTLTINYKYANGTTAAPTHTEDFDYGASYSITSPSITGYTPNLPVVSGTMGAEDVTVDVTYSVNSYTLTINYKYANGTTAAPTHTESLDYGASYSVTSPAITGYTPNLPVVSGTMGAEDVTVDVTYSVNSYTLTINYKYANGTTAAPTHTESLDYGASYSVTSPAITGYTPNLPIVSGTMGAEDVTVDVTYNVNSYTLTINYKYANGTTAAPTHTENLDYGASYSVTSPAITGYTPDLAVVTGTMGTENMTVDVTYTINSYTLTVNYLYADGTTAAASHTESVNYNASYSVTSPAITGYTPDLAVVTGTMGTENVTVDVTYTINSYILTVNYLYADGTTAAASHTESVNYNATYNVTSPAITGYTPDLAVVTGTMGTENVTVDVTYTINSYTLTVNYLYADGTTAATSHTESVNYNASYSVTSPAITGYTPDLAVVTGTMGTENVTVDVTYTINSYTLTVNYKYADGTTAAASHTESVNYNASYSVTSPAITGYTPDLAVVSGTMGTENVTVDVTYTINSYTLTVNYLYADGTTAAASHTESVNYNATYSVTSPAITGYTPDLAVVTGTMGTENVTVDVTYTINSYIISASANPTVGGSVNGAGTYNHFATAELTAIASTGYTFINWTENGTVVSTSPTISFMVEGPRTLVANFQLNSYQITAIANPTVGGTATGTGIYNHFETCTLVATPNEYYVFTNWTKNGQVVSNDATYSFTVEEGGTYVAHFTRVNHQITALANPTEGGSVSGEGSFPHGSYCTLTATANTGYTFFNWTKNGQVVSSNPSYSFSVTEDATYVANFNLNNYTITVSADPTAGGTVSGGGAYLYGNNCTVSAMANTGYTFTNWTKNGTVVSTDASYTFTVTENANLVAHFSLDHYNVTVSVDPEAGGTATGGGSFTYGETCNLSATPNTGYAFVNWTKNGSVVSTNASYSFTVTDNGDYVAHFSVARYTITLMAQPSEGGSVHGAGTYDYGHVVTLRAIAHEGYEFINWTKDGAVVSSNANYPIVVHGNAEYVANFRPYVFEIKANTDPDNSGDIEGIGLYNYGETCTLTVTPHDDYEFINWTLNGEVVSEEESISFIVTEAREYVAHLEYVEGIDEQSNLSVTLYPNPAKFKLTIEASEPIKMLEIFTIDGALVSKQDYSSDKIMINVDTLASGTYMIRLTTDSAVEIRRFVKE